MLLAEVTGHDRAQWITVPIRQIDAVHGPGEDGCRLERFLDRDRVGVIVHAIEPHTLRFGERPGRIDQIAQREAFPNRVAHQSGVESVADAHQCRLLLDDVESFQIQKAIGSRILNKAVHFQVPKIDIHPRVDHVLGHAIKQIVRRDRLHDAAFVLRAVVTERRGAPKFSD